MSNRTRRGVFSSGQASQAGGTKELLAFLRGELGVARPIGLYLLLQPVQLLVTGPFDDPADGGTVPEG